MTVISAISSFRFCPGCGGQNGGPASNKHFACPDCGYRFYTNAAAAVGAMLLNRNQELLLIQRARDPQRGKWNIPGGFVDAEETIDEALSREINEEIGVKAHDFRMLASFPNRYIYLGVTYATIDMFFTGWLGDERLVLQADEVSGYQWIRPIEVDPAELAFDSTRRALNALLKTHQ